MRTDGDQVVRPAGLRALLPRFEESIPQEYYRLGGKVTVVALALLLTVNVLGLADPERAGFRADVYAWYMVWNTPLVVAAMACGAALWRGRWSVPAMRRLLVTSMLLCVASTLLLIWLTGVVQSHMIVVGMLCVLVYRVFFDFRTGAITFLAFLLGHWAVAIAQTAGAIAVAPMQLSPPTANTSALYGAMAVISVMLVVTFVTANFTVARLHHKERAIRILRASLAAVGPGRIGRHTGRTLRDTYTLGALIGTGGMGEVYRAAHKRTRRELAIKMLHPHLLDDELLLKRFKREAEITGSLGSEHIVEIIDIDQEDEQPYLVLELLDGESLRARLDRRGPLPLAEVVDIVAQTAAGLRVAHGAGVVHRDLKPDNLFLCRRERGDVVKILDFGVSKIQGAATALTREVALVGTPDFMSPEQAVGVVDDIGVAADIFALGGIAYTALAGQPPFLAASVPALLRRICDEEPVPLEEQRPDLPAEVAAVVAIAMAKQPAHRYAAVAELAEDLAAAAAGELPAAVTARAAALPRARPATRTGVATPGASAAGDTITADTLRGRDTIDAGTDQTLDAER